MNYIPDAKQFGADIFTGIDVKNVEKNGNLWNVNAEVTIQRKLRKNLPGKPG